MKSSASESVRNACSCFNLEGLSRSFRLARQGISPLERLWNGFHSDAELFTAYSEPNAQFIITYLVISLTEMSIFLLLSLVRLELRSTCELIHLV